MNKTVIQKFAVWARTELIEQVAQRAYQYGIDEDGYGDKDVIAINGRILASDELKQRKELIDKIDKKGYKQVMEEVAYTWFNRFIALRFMEVNNYLPSHIRIFSDSNGEFKPEILKEALRVELGGIDKAKVETYIENNQTEDLYRHLLLTQCNALNKVLPDTFEEMGGYTGLLLPNNILKSESVIGHLVQDIPEEDFNITVVNEAGKPNGQVEILGWLYQHYISEPKDVLINAKKQYKKDDIPFVTQIFTSDWIVKYIVDNSLGRYWIERNPESKLREKLEFFVTPKNGEFEYINEKINPENITFFDPCMGSGHILIYAFDVFMEIYKECGYSERDAAQSIIQNNLFGVDIDERAYQYAYFAVMMKARSYDRRFLTRNIAPKLSIIEESNEIKSHTFEGITYDKDLDKIGEYLCDVFKDAKEIGSLQTVEKGDYQAYLDYLNNCKMEGQMTFDSDDWCKDTLPTLKALAAQADILAQKYTVICTNPPYMPNSKMTVVLKSFIEEKYSLCKSDTFSAFIYRCMEYCINMGYVGMLTPFVWMFISSYEDLRKELLSKVTLISLVQLEYNSFEAACVPVCTFVFENNKCLKRGEYINLSEFKGIDIQAPKTIEAIYSDDCSYRFSTLQEKFYKIEGFPIAYWISNNVLSCYEKGISLGEISAPRKGNSTSNNEKFLRLWFEVDKLKTNYKCKEIIRENTLVKRWFPYNKGGGYRKWYGNNEYLIDWYDDAVEIRNIKTAVIANYQYFMKPGLTWSTVSSSNFSIRYFEEGFIFDNGGCCIFDIGDNREYILSLLNSKIFKYIFGSINQTLNFQSGEVAKFPVILETQCMIDVIAKKNIMISREDWDSFETSWNFLKHPLIKGSNIRETFEIWKEECESDFNELKSNEEELNRIFIEIYGLQDELTPEVEDKDITLKTNTAYRYKQKKKKNSENEFEPEEEIVEAKEIRDQRFLHDTVTEFISYAIGCMFGRYSLDVEGLIYAGGEWDETMYNSIIPDKDNIIPICDDEYFDDDITGRFIEFVKTVYGDNSLEENLNFIADALGGKGSSREIIRNYFINDFFKDHCNMYTSRGAGKRPIYWLFDSGKKNGFKAIIYMHRYQPDLLARMRTDYVHEQQERYRTRLTHILDELNHAQGAEKVKLTKIQKKIQEQVLEIQKYEEKIHHLADRNIPIDLDDGVKHNYELFGDVLAKIK